MKVYIETFGCQMNEYDTELVKAVLQESNYKLIGSVEEAEVVLLNTCSVRDKANRKIYNRIHKINQNSNSRSPLIGILGCMATNFRQELLEKFNLPIDFIAGPDSYKRLPKLIEQVKTSGKKSFDVTLSEFETYSDVYPSREKGVNAWIAVMRGCDNFCTFCVVPYTRGRERSRAPDNILEEVRRLAADGFRQVTLLGQNVNSYDYNGKNFAGLLDRISDIEDIKRIRYMSPHPKDFPDQLIKVTAENHKICKHIHLPIQSGNNRILDLMNRTYTHQEYLQLINNIRSRCPDIVLTTDIIVGFPTETEKEHLDTAAIMEEVKFDSAFIFKYSERPGTIAQKKYPDDIPEEVKTERIVQLNQLQNEHSLSKNLTHIGQVHEILIEEQKSKKSETDFQGRNDGNKLVIFPGGDYKAGQFINVKITDATTNVLKGVVVSKIM